MINQVHFIKSGKMTGFVKKVNKLRTTLTGMSVNYSRIE